MTHTKHQYVFALLLCILAGTWPSFAPADSTARLVQTADQLIIPAYRQLELATAQLRDRTESFCAAPGETALQELRSAFDLTMDAWQSVQYIRFGPVEYLLRGPRFQLWPDKRGSVNKHLSKLLASADRSALEPERFAQGSVAVQGLSALEMLLFDADAAGSFDQSDAGRYRCAVALAITGNLAHMASALLADWTQGESPHRGFFTTATNGNNYYESDTEVMSKLLNNLHTQLQFIAEQKLDRPLGPSLARANGRRAESWRSTRSLRNIQLNLNAMKTLYLTAFAGQITDPELAHEVTIRFDEAVQQAARIPPPLDQAVKDEDARQAALDLRAQVAQLQALFAGPVPQNLGLSLGFNSLDGD